METLEDQFLEIISLEAEDDRITVMVSLPYIKKGSPLILVYGCKFTVDIGQTVLCPPTPKGPPGQWFTGMVIALDGGDYKGPVKYVKPIGDNNG